MTIETKRWGHMDWDCFGNSREMKKGEKIMVTRLKPEGIHVWTLEALGPDTARATYTCPFTINPDGSVIPDKADTRQSVIQENAINMFGYENFPWRWRPAAGQIDNSKDKPIISQ